MSQADELARLGLATEAEPPLAADEEARVFAALEAALRPSELSAEVNERLLELALEDPLAPPTDEELVESARLRDALAQGSPHEDADVLRALRASFAPQVNDDETANEQALASALGSARAGKQARGTAPRSRGKLIFAAFGAASAVLAAAAAALLFVTASRSEAPPSAASEPTAALVRPHSTAPLFPDRFDNDTTARMDLIASVRSRDLRDNRYTSWGVR